MAGPGKTGSAKGDSAKGLCGNLNEFSFWWPCSSGHPLLPLECFLIKSTMTRPESTRPFSMASSEGHEGHQGGYANEPGHALYFPPWPWQINYQVLNLNLPAATVY